MSNVGGRSRPAGEKGPGEAVHFGKALHVQGVEQPRVAGFGVSAANLCDLARRSPA